MKDPLNHRIVWMGFDEESNCWLIDVAAENGLVRRLLYSPSNWPFPEESL